MLEAALQAERALDLYVVIADENRRAAALEVTQALRQAGFRAAYPLTDTKVARQFQTAEEQGAGRVIVVGAEYPALSIKDLASRTERSCLRETLLAELGPP